MKTIITAFAFLFAITVSSCNKCVTCTDPQHQLDNPSKTFCKGDPGYDMAHKNEMPEHDGQYYLDCK